jgi:hypothetical protein
MNAEAQFVARHSQSEFRHRDELLSLLAAGDVTCEANASSLPCAQLMRIYRRRAQHLRRYSTAHAQQLRDDVAALCDALVKASDENCLLWVFSWAPNSDYTVFEGAETGLILGCVLARDKRLTPSDEWNNLWREANAR